MDSWQLPEGIDELVGARALKLEKKRRALIDFYQENGYELVFVPLVEYVESLLLQYRSVDLKTFKFLDSKSRKMLGVHADISPQIARIDALRKTDASAKYCYLDTILQTHADDFYTTRSPIQTGVEIYGRKDIDADEEVISMMVQSLGLVGVDSVIVSLGSVVFFNALAADENFNQAQKSQLRDIFQRRSKPDLTDFLNRHSLQNPERFLNLMTLEGDFSTLQKAEKMLGDLPEIQTALDELGKLSARLKNEVNIVFDFAELKTYEYHTGIVFSAYHPKFSKALAQGGRYNGLGENFGAQRPATGFSFDLKFLSSADY